MSKLIEVLSELDYQAALRLTRGSYQRNILLGIESISGSTLVGTARSYGYHYAQSRKSLLHRMREAHITFSIAVREPGHRHVLVIGI